MVVSMGKKQNITKINDKRFEQLTRREQPVSNSVDVTKNVTTDKPKDKDNFAVIRKGFTWLLTIGIGTILTYLLVILGAQLTAVVVAQALMLQSILSSDAILIASSSFATSIVWIVVFKVKLYERLYQLFDRRFGGRKEERKK